MAIEIFNWIKENLQDGLNYTLKAIFFNKLWERMNVQGVSKRVPFSNCYNSCIKC